MQIQEIKGNQATTKQRQVKTSIFLTAQKAGPYVYMFVQLSNTQTELGVCGEALPQSTHSFQQFCLSFSS